MEIKDITIQDGSFVGCATFKTGFDFPFSVTREEIIKFLIDHRKGRLVYEKDGTTLQSDRKLITHYLEQSERVYMIEYRKENPLTHGGAREGSGRKPKESVATQSITVTLRKDFVDIIRRNYPNRSEFIQQAIREKLRRECLI